MDSGGVAPSAEPGINFEHYREGLTEEIQNNLCFSYVDFSDIATEENKDFYIHRNFLSALGISFVPDLLWQLGVIIYDLAKLVFFDVAYSLFSQDANHLYVQTFQLLRDGEEFAGTCLLVAGYVEGYLLIEHAFLHTEAYKTFLQHQSSKNPPKVEELESPEDQATLSQILDYTSYREIEKECFENKKYELLFKAAEKYTSLYGISIPPDDIYSDIAEHFATHSYAEDLEFFRCTLKAIEKVSSEGKNKILNSIIKIFLQRECFLLAITLILKATETSDERDDLLVYIAKNTEEKIALEALKIISHITHPIKNLILQIASDCLNTHQLDLNLVSSALTVVRHLQIKERDVDNWYAERLYDQVYGFKFLGSPENTQIRHEKLEMTIRQYFVEVAIAKQKVENSAAYNQDPESCRELEAKTVNRHLEYYKSEILKAEDKDTFKSRLSILKSNTVFIDID